jgi:hypothetical protein
MKTFNTSLVTGNHGEHHFENYLRSNPNVVSFKKMDYITDFNRTSTGVEYDYLVRQADGNDYKVEIKTITGASVTGSRYPTFPIEVYSSNDKSSRPGWYRSAMADSLDLIVIVSKFDRKMYFFDPKQLAIYVNGLSSVAYTRCHDGNKDNKGWIVKVPWEQKMAGFLFARDIV